jgi:hypothetical protein
MSLQEAADARKAKLAALKKRKQLHESGAPTDEDANGAEQFVFFHLSAFSSHERD